MGSLSEPELIVNYNDNNNNAKDNIKNSSEPDTPKSLEIQNEAGLLAHLQSRLYTNLDGIISEFGSSRYKTAIGLIELLAFYQICKAFFVEIKWSPKMNEEIVLTDFMKNFRLNRHFKKLILTLLRRLGAHGILVEIKKDREFRVIMEPPSAPTIRTETKNILTKAVEYPEFAQEFSCTDYFGSHLASVLTEKQTGLNVLFPDEKDTLKFPYAAKTFYQKSHIMKVCKVIPTIQGMTEYMNHVLHKTKFNPQPTIKILEIGAGTGGTTIPLLKSWKPKGLLQNMHYTFTDISNFFVGNTKSIILSQFPELNDGNMEFKLLDIENCPQDQGFELNSFDMILAADVFHATEYLEDTVSHTRSLLKSRGLLVLGEVFQSTMFVETSFGLTSGWWRFGDKLRKHASPLLRPDEWNVLLKSHGFLDSFSIGDENYGIIFAQAN